MPIECPICTESIADGNAVALPCGHVYDSQCALEWFNRSLNCAMCRKGCNPRNIIPLFINSSNETDEKMKKLTRELQKRHELCKALKDMLTASKRQEFELKKNESGLQNNVSRLRRKVELLTLCISKNRGKIDSFNNRENQLQQELYKLAACVSDGEKKLASSINRERQLQVKVGFLAATLSSRVKAQ